MFGVKSGSRGWRPSSRSGRRHRRMRRRRCRGAARARPRSIGCPTQRRGTPCTSPISGRRRSRPLRRHRTEDRRRHRRDRQLVAPRGRDAVAARGTVRGPRLCNGVRRLRHLEYRAAAGGTVIVSAFQELRPQLASSGSTRPRRLSRLLRRADRTGRPKPGLRTGGAHKRRRAPRHGRRLPRLVRRGRRRLVRPVVATHELVHLSARSSGQRPTRARADTSATRERSDGRLLSGEELEGHVLDGGHDDYYGHTGTWPECRTRPSSNGSIRPTGGRRPHRGRPGRGRSQRPRARLLAGIEGRRRPGRLPPLRERAVRPPGVAGDGATAGHGGGEQLCRSGQRSGRTVSAPSTTVTPGPGHSRRARPAASRHGSSTGDHERHGAAEQRG